MTRKGAKDTKESFAAFVSFRSFRVSDFLADKELYQRQVEATDRQIEGLVMEGAHLWVTIVRCQSLMWMNDD